MQRDTLLLTEMIDAAEQAQRLAAGLTVNQLEGDRQRRDALLWNFTVLGPDSPRLLVYRPRRSPDDCGQAASRIHS